MKKTIEFAIQENLNGYRWHIYQPNFSSLSSDFYCESNKLLAEDHLNVQLNVPDNCLNEIAKLQPSIGKLDEHFMIRGKNYLPPMMFQGLGYKNKFSYQEIKETIDNMFPSDWVLNEEVLYDSLFNSYDK